MKPRDPFPKNRYDIPWDKAAFLVDMTSLSYYTRFALGVVCVMSLWGWAPRLVAQQEGAALPPHETIDVQNFVITMESYVFTPSELVLDKGKPFTLTLTNQSFLVPHNFLLDDPNGTRLVDTEISSGDTEVVSLTLTQPGIYPYYCDKQFLFFPNHREEGMEGRIIIP